MRIVVVGIGYAGLANAVLLAQHNTVIAVDIAQFKVDMLNRRESWLVDNEIQYYRRQSLKLSKPPRGCKIEAPKRRF